MKPIALALSLASIAACGGALQQDAAIDSLAAQVDPITTYAAAKALAETQPNVHQAVALHLTGALSGTTYAWSWTFADRLNQVVVAVGPRGGVKVASTMHQVDYLGPNPIDPAAVKIHPAALLTLCKQKGYQTAPAQLDLARALTRPEADWYVELGAQGSLRVDAATGVVGR